MAARDVIQEVWYQRCKLMKKHYNPKLEILIHEDDVNDILVEKFEHNELCMIFGHPFEWMGAMPSKMFGEPMVISDEACVGEPLVTIK